MKRTLMMIAFLLLAGPMVFAQNTHFTIPDGYEMVDSIVFRPTASVDSSLVGKDIFSVMASSENVKIHQSSDIMNALRSQIESNSSKVMSGYRIRIFFDNKQSARNASEGALARFTSAHPGIGAYRTYSNPFFKVTVGDFRSRSEAMELLSQIKDEFPSAFIVKENIHYPVITIHNRPFVADTLHILRLKQAVIF